MIEGEEGSSRKRNEGRRSEEERDSKWKEGNGRERSKRREGREKRKSDGTRKHSITNCHRQHLPQGVSAEKNRFKNQDFFHVKKFVRVRAFQYLPLSRRF